MNAERVLEIAAELVRAGQHGSMVDAVRDITSAVALLLLPSTRHAQPEPLPHKAP
jgi:hypothetical protein